MSCSSSHVLDCVGPKSIFAPLSFVDTYPSQLPWRHSWPLKNLRVLSLPYNTQLYCLINGKFALDSQSRNLVSRSVVNTFRGRFTNYFDISSHVRGHFDRQDVDTRVPSHTRALKPQARPEERARSQNGGKSLHRVLERHHRPLLTFTTVRQLPQRREALRFWSAMFSLQEGGTVRL